MTRERLTIFDTTLRDGAQTTGVDFSLADKVRVAQMLDEGRVDMAEAQIEIEKYWAGALRRAVIDGDVDNGSVMAGQSVGMVTREEPVAAIIAELAGEAEVALTH